jgi:predicted transcriptional regulator/predicted phosphodiesterase
LSINTKLTSEEIEQLLQLAEEGQTKTAIAAELGISRSTVSRLLVKLKGIPEVFESVEDFDGIDDAEIVDENIKLAKKVFKLQDVQRVERKSFREHARVDNMILALHQGMKEVLDKNEFSRTKLHEYTASQAPVGIVQLSDVHFNELIDDLRDNEFNFEIASKRLHKLIRKAKPLFKANGVKEVALFLTGDLLNSDRRLDEITNAATNRSRAVFLAVDIIQQIIIDLNKDFNVTVASITGNESRVGEHVHFSDFLAGDSYDIVIHNMLTYLFKGHAGIKFVPVENPVEAVVNVNGNNILLVHGNLHKGMARNPESEIEKIKARYAIRGTLISYVLMGHIHCAQVSDLYARSSGLPGSNAYSERALNLSGRASQNVYLVHNKFGEIDGIKIDLQNVDDEPMYNFDETLASYKTKKQQGTYVIQSVTI